MKSRLVFFDLETGGLDENRHAIIQIAAIAVEEETLKEVAQFECKLCFEEGEADAEALAANSYDPAVWAYSALPKREACSGFSAFLKNHATVEMISQRTGRPYYVAQMVGHNAASFDARFLQAFYRKLNEFCPAGFLVLDTLQRALWFFRENPQMKKPDNFKLETLCRYFNIPPFASHDAIADVRATLALYVAIRQAAEARQESLLK
jgi:DNA polymerase III epsilon subunit-like protein